MIKPVDKLWMFRSLIASMTVIREFQLGKRTLEGRAEVKTADQTLKTLCDTKSGEAAKKHLIELPDDIFELMFEDISGRKNKAARYRILNDNLDGTRIFTNGGSTSTAILRVYDKESSRIVLDMVGEAATGRILSADSERYRSVFRC